MYDYFLGGSDNYAVDREACEALLRMAPSTRELSLINRAFLVRAVRYLAGQHGVRRFIDIGSGLPTSPNVHEVAQEVDPRARVVYVDSDPIVLAHAGAMLARNPETTAVINADMRDRDALFGHEAVGRLLSGGEPVAVLLVSVLHCLKDEDDPWGLVRDVVNRLPRGSFLVVSQLASKDPQLRQEISDFMQQSTGDWGRVRSFDEVARYFEGLTLLEAEAPVEVSTWNPDTELGPRQAQQEWIELGGVARIG